MIADSRTFNEELALEIEREAEPVATGTSGAGKLYRTWMDMKVLLTAGNVKTILSDCETIENAIQRAYDDALSEQDLPASAINLISEQRAALLESYHQIRHLSDIASA